MTGQFTIQPPVEDLRNAHRGAKYAEQIPILGVLCVSVVNSILYDGNRRLYTFLAENLHVFAMNFRRLVCHWNHRPERITKTIVTVLRTVASHRKMAHRRIAGVEMAMPH